MNNPRSKFVLFLSLIYCLFSVAGLYTAVLGNKTKPDKIPLINESDIKSEQLIQARLSEEFAQKQTPEHLILNMFYKGWLLEFYNRDLKKYQEPRFEGDSWEKRIKSFNQTVKHIPQIYQEGITTLTILSAGSLFLIIIMLFFPGYFISLLLSGYPLMVAFTCYYLHINYKILDFCWIPFIILGGLIFISQFIFSLKFGNRPEHIVKEGQVSLILYRRGLTMFTFGFCLTIFVLLKTGGAIKNLTASGRGNLLLMIFGEDVVMAICMISGVFFLLTGINYFLKKLREDKKFKLSH